MDLQEAQSRRPSRIKELLFLGFLVALVTVSIISIASNETPIHANQSPKDLVAIALTEGDSNSGWPEPDRSRLPKGFVHDIKAAFTGGGGSTSVALQTRTQKALFMKWQARVELQGEIPVLFLEEKKPGGEKVFRVELAKEELGRITMTRVEGSWRVIDVDPFESEAVRARRQMLLRAAAGYPAPD
jgi:hypothetical protein